MYVDAQQKYSDAQALTVTAVSTNAIDHSQDRNFGIGKPMAIVITVTVAAGGTTPTMQATLQADTTSAFGAPVTVAATGVLTGTQMAAGAKFILPVPADLLTARFTRLNYTMGGTSPTVTVTAWLTPADAIQNEVYYPAGTTVQ